MPATCIVPLWVYLELYSKCAPLKSIYLLTFQKLLQFQIHSGGFLRKEVLWQILEEWAIFCNMTTCLIAISLFYKYRILSSRFS